jgi:hypothetical protein
LPKKFYGTIGKYIGNVLYNGMVLTLIFPIQTTYSFVQYAFAAFFAISLVSRIISFAKMRDSASIN